MCESVEQFLTDNVDFAKSTILHVSSCCHTYYFCTVFQRNCQPAIDPKRPLKSRVIKAFNLSRASVLSPQP